MDDAACGRESFCVILIKLEKVHSRKVEFTLNLLKTLADMKIIGHMDF